MLYRKQLSSVIDQVINTNEITEIESTIVEEYKQLDNACNNILEKIKRRKQANKVKIND